MKKNKGITLISLIITIVVMVILVGVSVSTLVESDLIGAAEKAGNAYKTAYEKEQSLGKITVGDTTYNSLDEYMQSLCSHVYGAEVVVEATCIQEGNKTKTCTICGKVESQIIPVVSHNFGLSGACTVCGATCAHNYVDGTCIVCGTTCAHNYVDGTCTVCGITCTHNYVNGTCTKCGTKKTLPVITAGAKATENSIYSDGTDTALIPAKFTVSGAPSENTIAGGLVIYLIDDKTDAEIAAINWNTDLATLQTKYDQFVWIPIKNTTTERVQDINDMYICQNKGKGSYGTSSCVITVPDAAREAICSTHGNCTAMAGRLYAAETGEAFENKYTEVYTLGSGLREPDIVTGNNAGDGTSYDGTYTETSGVKTYTHLNTIKTILGDNTNYENLTTWKSALQTEYNNIVKSVYLNEGFYVGRYETSGMTQSTSNYNVAVIAGVLPSVEADWYHMYAQQKKYASSNNLTVGSTMIQGAAYDQVMKFVDTNAYRVTVAGEVGHSFGDIYNTGSQSGDQSKNIFDLEGNTRAWTTEASNSSGRVDRGRLLLQQSFSKLSYA